MTRLRVVRVVLALLAALFLPLAVAGPASAASGTCAASGVSASGNWARGANVGSSGTQAGKVRIRSSYRGTLSARILDRNGRSIGLVSASNTTETASLAYRGRSSSPNSSPLVRARAQVRGQPDRVCSFYAVHS